MVSSGAIGVGLRRMGMDKRPKHLPGNQVRRARLDFCPTDACQALAAVGQCRLMSLWDSLFNHLQQPVAQILLTRNDIADVRDARPRIETNADLRSERNISMLRTPSSSS